MQTNNYGQQNNHAPQNTQQGGNQVSQPIDKGYIKVVREYIRNRLKC